MPEREYDVVLYGASGFTGKQTVQYFAKHVDRAQVRWAIAGRNRQKLEAVKAQIGPAAANVDVLQADSQNQEAVDAMVSQTRVLLNTAGPFTLYGDAIVNACVRLKTHYVDITGETPWVKNLIVCYHNQAAADGTRIIPFCGFDSVPSDLGTYLVVRHIQKELGVPCSKVKAYFQFDGGLNGGTLASGFNLQASGQSALVRDPFLLNPQQEHSKQEMEQNRDPEEPLYDRDMGTWVAPFFMSAINTRVVRRSSALYEQWQELYGPDFSYQEYLKFDEPFAWIKAAGVTAGMALFAGALQQPPIRSLLTPVMPQPGSGPSEKVMEEGWFRCELLGIAMDGRRVHGLIRDQGDPGNRATVKFLCESALSLALNPNALPGGPQRGGILTPATGLGDVLADRLRKAGMTIAVGI
jgi:short subunit dehydrogenase-like uncharacterized protein